MKIMKAMILAAGLGKRMLPLTKNTPKPLLTINNKLLIEHSIISLQKSGITELIINLHYLGDQIKNTLGNGSKWGVNIVYSEETNLLDTGGAIIHAINNKLLDNQEPFLVISADIITDFDFSLLKLQPTKLAHLLLVPNPDFNLKGDFSLQADGHINFTQANQPSYTYANIGIFHPALFLHNPEQTIVPLVKLLHKGMALQQITAELYYGLWANIGDLQELAKVKSWQI